MTYIESGFGHISSMDSIYGALVEDYSHIFDVEKSFIMHDDPDLKRLARLERFFVKQVQNTNKFAWFGDFIFTIINLLGNAKLMRFVHRQLAYKSFREGLEALRRREPDIIVTNHYFTDLLAVEYKRRIDPDVVVINYNPDNTLHSFWDRRDGIFVVNNQKALERALKLKFDKDKLKLVTPCVRKCVEAASLDLDRALLRDKFGLPQDKFTVVCADGGYMLGRAPKYARAMIKAKLPITLCVICGNNDKRYEEFTAIAEGRGKLKLPDGMTLKVYKFLSNAYELYGAADVFVTKGGPNAVLDSVYMRTPVLINYCPHMIEKMTVKFFVDMYGCGDRAFRKGKTVKRIERLMNDRSELDGYCKNIEKFLEQGNGADAVADIIAEAAERQRAEAAARGKVYDDAMPRGEVADSAKKILDSVMTDDNIIAASEDTQSEITLP